jgi:hypothetical protein
VLVGVKINGLAIDSQEIKRIGLIAVVAALTTVLPFPM